MKEQLADERDPGTHRVVQMEVADVMIRAGDILSSAGFVRFRDVSRGRYLIGALDLGAGALFGASLLGCLNPYTAAAAIVLTAARAAYEHRDLVRSTLHRLGDRLRGRNHRQH